MITKNQLSDDTARFEWSVDGWHDHSVSTAAAKAETAKEGYTKVIKCVSEHKMFCGTTRVYLVAVKDMTPTWLDQELGIG